MFRFSGEVLEVELERLETVGKGSFQSQNFKRVQYLLIHVLTHPVNIWRSLVREVAGKYPAPRFRLNLVEARLRGCF